MQHGHPGGTDWVPASPALSQGSEEGNSRICGPHLSDPTTANAWGRGYSISLSLSFLNCNLGETTPALSHIFTVKLEKDLIELQVLCKVYAATRLWAVIP